MSESQAKDAAQDPDIEVKVTDRRKFDREGKPRGDSPAEEEPAPQPAGGKVAEEAAAATPAPAAAKAPETGARDAAAMDADGAPQVDFQSFVYFLYMSALHELGIPTQEGDKARPADLERARFFVEVLRLLELKTKGNLEPGEIKLLEEALYNLRMQYVGISQKAGS